MKKAFITGIAGQDGSYLAELLLERGYEVHGLARQLPVENNQSDFFRITHILPRIAVHAGDIVDGKRIHELVAEIRPDEVYDLAAIVDPLVSFDTEYKILHNNISGIHNLLGAVRKYVPSAKLYFAASSLIFGKPEVSPQDEGTPKNPVTPYGIAKATGCNLVKMYRDVYGIFACAGILYNHESPRRDPIFLPRKITQAAVRIKKGLQPEMKLGDLDAMRDWGFAGDFAKSMWLMLQRETPEDYVIGTGEAHSVREFLEIAFGLVDLDWKQYVKVDEGLIRSKEPHILVANPKKAKEELKWSPHVKFDDLVKMMVDADMQALS